MAKIDDIIDGLKNATIENTESTLSLLNKVTTSEPNSFDNYNLTEPLLRIITSSNVEVCKEAAKCIAEVTKTEAQRKKFTQKEIIEALINCLRRNSNENFDMDLTIQICRALGNICYMNDDARNMILNIEGDADLMRLLDIEAGCDSSKDLQFIKVRGGFISNYLLGGEILAKRAMELKIMDKIQAIIDKCMTNVEQNEDLLLNILPPLSILTENVSDLNFEPKLNKQLAQILAGSTNPDLAELCLELLHYQAENDDVKLLLAKEGLCETIYKLLEKYKTLASTSEARALMKLACDLIVLILTGDESMHYLYSTPLLKNMEDWLDSYDIDLLTTGVLALGNFARTDSHCIDMVENKIMNKLLAILSKNNGVDDDMRLQHALLSTLRNLVIPKPNKGAVIEAGLVQTILPMLEIHQPPVVFKLLGTLRMTVDGQESLALELLQNKKLIEQLVHWSKSSDYAGVTGESLRLMAWLIKHAYHTRSSVPSTSAVYIKPDEKGCSLVNPAEPVTATAGIGEASSSTGESCSDITSLRAFIHTEGTVDSMINMLTSQHLVMQNEALIALSILSTMFLCESNEDSSMSSVPSSSKSTALVHLDDLFIQSELGKKLSEFIGRSSDTMTKEIVENLKIFTSLLRNSEKLIKHLEQYNIDELLKSIPILTEYCTL
ncbi:rap1 GTPase-GDP dissociation stimulator 1 isoform X2 [Hermetia illucens]|uniref:rap1 GTPase-GDP dissociation stimulator 1 isoform X2 n=1 Tax=Hermetia illucens TaxID=343691 RepID=UPI0018CC0C48|nr:rap1 GTPase-GDP dissociation stimulator 1 isoform X2 [Hermetia illucens]